MLESIVAGIKKTVEEIKGYCVFENDGNFSVRYGKYLFCHAPTREVAEFIRDKLNETSFGVISELSARATLAQKAVDDAQLSLFSFGDTKKEEDNLIDVVD